MKPIYVIFIFFLVYCVLDASAVASDACGGCAEGQICRQYTEDGIRVRECVNGEATVPDNIPETSRNSGPSSCNVNNCPPPKVCVNDEWAKDIGYCINSSNSNNNSPDASNCSMEFNARLETCRQDAQEAVNSCDEKQDAGINKVNNQASQVAIMMGQMAASSIQAACSKMASLSQAANAAVAAYQMNCANSIGSCKSVCNEAKNYVRQNALCLAGGVLEDRAGVLESMTSAVDQELEKCNKLTANVAQANSAIQNYASTSANASQCAAFSDGTGVPPEICKTDPKNPICIKPGDVDCTKPEMATNKVCVCSRNPFDPMCSSGQKVGGGIGASGGGNIDSSSRLMNSASSGRTGDIPSLPGIEQGEFKDSGGAVGPDAEKVGNGGVGGGGGGSGGGHRGAGGSGGGGDDESSKVVSGFYGGSGGGAKGFGSGGSGENGRGYVPGVGGVTGKGNPTPDLRKFLPGGQYDPRRMISGISGPDGITGPHSNIWLKIQNRYQMMRGSLLP